jgi:molybdopterin synthase sulfur carrier subunit
MDTAMVTVRYWAGAQEAAGQTAEHVPASTLGGLLDALADRPKLARVLPACSLLLDGQALRRADPDHPLPDGAVVDVLPPFAGG